MIDAILYFRRTSSQVYVTLAVHKLLNLFPPHLQTYINVHYLMLPSHPYKPPLIATPAEREAHLIAEHSSRHYRELEFQHPGFPTHLPIRARTRNHLTIRPPFDVVHLHHQTLFQISSLLLSAFFERWLKHLGCITVPDESG